jgi:hypothetical protein
MFMNAIELTKGMFEVYRQDRTVPLSVKQAMLTLSLASSSVSVEILKQQLVEEINN